MGEIRFKDLSEKEVDLLIDRCENAIASEKPLATDDVRLLLEAFKSLMHLQEKLRANDLTMRRLKKLLGILSSSEKKKDLYPHDESEGSKADGTSDSGGSVGKGPHGSPHGKRKSKDFEEAKVEHHKLTDLKSGDECPKCKQGKVYKYPPSEFVRFTGEAPLQVTIHVREQLRCNFCHEVFTADVPQVVKEDGPGDERFGYSAIALIAMLKYCAGMPFFRMQELQKMLKVPVTASTLWDQCEKMANVAMPVFKYMLEMAAEGVLFFSDDTSNKVLDLKPRMKKRRGSDKEQLRSGIHTSGVISVMDDGREIILYKTGINHAGEFLQEILARRSSNEPFIHMADALSSNKVAHAGLVRSLCNAHARRQFTDIKENFPEEAKFVVDLYEDIAKNEAHTKAAKMTPAERLVFHKTNSLPLMEKLFKWAQKKFDDREAEPNSTLGKALSYLISHQEGLTAFCSHERAPIDNNKQEQKLKVVVLGRKNHYFFKHSVGAAVADVVMTVAATTRGANANVHHYLTSLQRYAAAVKKSPQDFLPWNYQETLAGLQKS